MSTIWIVLTSLPNVVTNQPYGHNWPKRSFNKVWSRRLSIPLLKLMILQPIWTLCLLHTVLAVGRIWFVTCKWPARRRANHSLNLNWFMPTLAPTGSLTWKSLSLVLIMLTFNELVTVAMTTECTSQPNCSTTMFQILLDWPSLWYTWKVFGKLLDSWLFAVFWHVLIYRVPGSRWFGPQSQQHSYMEGSVLCLRW